MGRVQEYNPGIISGSIPDTATGKDSGVRMLRLSQVDPNRSQPRSRFEEEALEELADSIRQFGILQPILVQKKGARYEIIAGERRWRASRKAGLKEIPAVVREYSDEEAVELSLIENIQREDLNPIEEAKAFKRLLEEFGLRQEELAARVSKSRTAITNAVRLLKLDERVQDMIVEEQLSMGHARALIPVEIPEEQFLLAQQIANKKLSVREVEKLVKKHLSKSSGKKGKAKGGQTEEDPALLLAYREIEERLKQTLGTKATIRHSAGGAGRLEIEFYSHEDLEKIVDLLS
ncbi:MAG: ParB/RepB/Spo0J family partition protein [Eubacteriales bacterium]|nr:ParB/RepB/Spo0J family partition protein [Eubacteriales bacterium]